MFLNLRGTAKLDYGWLIPHSVMEVQPYPYCDVAYNPMLRLLEELEPQHRQSLLRLLEELQLQHQQSLLRVLKKLHPLYHQSLLSLLEGLEPQHQQSLLTVLEKLHPLYHESLLSLLEELQPQHQQSLLRLLEELQSWHHDSLLILLKGLEPVYQQQLLHCLEEEKAEYRKAWLSIFKAVEPQYKHSLLTIRRWHTVEKLLRVLGGLKPLEKKGLLSLLEVQDSLEPFIHVVYSKVPTPLEKLIQRLQRASEEQEPLLEQAFRLLQGLEPLEQKMLLRLLEEQESLLGQVLRLLQGLDPLEQGKLLLRLLEGHECEQEKLLNLLDKLAELGLLQLLEGLERPDLSKVLRLVERLDTLGRLEPLKGLELLPVESRMIKLKKPLKLLEILETAKPPKKAVIMGQLKMELARLEEQLRLTRLVDEFKHLLQQLVEWLMVYLSEDGGRGSGLSHLLLDAWWLEFWELVLLAAGDVERNPGPRRMTDEQLAKIDSRALRKDGDLHKVLDAVYDCRAKWYNLCLALQVPDDDLSAIKREHRDIATCLLRGISLWLQRVHSYGPPTWRVLVDAIANSSGGDNHVLALDIADKHQAITIVSSCHHTCAESADHKKSKEMSSTFNGMYRSIVKHLRVDVRKVRDSLCFLTDPRHPDQLCVPPSVYEDATSTKELLTRLCPRYVNPVNTFVLEEIVRKFGSQKCKRLLQDYTDKYMQ